MNLPHAQPFERFVEPARPKAEVWRTVLGLCLIALIWGATAAVIVLGYALLAGGDSLVAAIAPLAEPTKPIHMFVLLATFGGMALGAALVTRLLHKRKSHTLLGPLLQVLPDFAKAAIITAVIYCVTVSVWFGFSDAVPNMALGRWLLLLPLAALGLLVQTLSEELIFRGYLQQQLAARFSHAIMWMIFPSILFGFAHYDPATTGENLWMIVLATGIFGLIAADLTARTGGLGAAWGLHFANNFFAILVVAVDGTLPGLALYLTPYAADDPILRQLIWIDIATLVLVWLVLIRAFRR